MAAYREELKTEPFSALVIAAATALADAGRQDDGVQLLRDWVAKQPDPTVSNELAAIEIASRRYDAPRNTSRRCWRPGRTTRWR